MALTQREVIEHIRAARGRRSPAIQIAKPRARPLAPLSSVKALSLAEVVRRYILITLRRCGGNISEAARVLGLERSSLQRKLRRYGAR